MYQAAVQLADRSLKVSVGAGPPNLTFHVDARLALKALSRAPERVRAEIGSSSTGLLAQAA